MLKSTGPIFQAAPRLVRNKTTTLKELEDFLDRLTQITFCDPACGCGNFLVVAYRELRAIETDIIARLRQFESHSATTLDVMFEQRLSIDQFYGFELNWWPAKIAELAMFLVDHQANQELAKRIGVATVRLPIKTSAHIIHGNALHLDWESELPTTEQTYIFGNPPFVGHKTKSEEQRADLKLVWGKNFDGYLDYVTGWHAKTLKALRHRPGEFAYVTTNSICQGQPVAALFDPIYELGRDIKFAHRTFAWDSEAPGQAAVHCIIVGFTRNRANKQQAWEYHDVHGEAQQIQLSKQLNAYLVEDNYHTLVRKRRGPLSAELTESNFGTMPLGKALLVEKEDYEAFASDPIASKYLREFKGAHELITGEERWCLWMADDDFLPADINYSSLLKQRVQASHQWRSAQKPTGDAYKFKDVPHLFRPNKKRPLTAYVCVPRHVSATRKYFLAEHYQPNVISSDANFTINDPDGLQFALISSSMFIAWQRAVGGQIKSDLRFSKTLVWNNFPVPELDQQTKQTIIKAGEGVQAARNLHPGRSLADAYNPLAMDPALLKAHDNLDRAVDKAFGATKKLSADKQRLELLFAHYATMTD